MQNDFSLVRVEPEKVISCREFLSGSSNINFQFLLYFAQSTVFLANYIDVQSNFPYMISSMNVATVELMERK